MDTKINIATDLFMATGINYVSSAFGMHYVLDQAKSVDTLLSGYSDKMDEVLKDQLRNLLVQASTCVNEWEINDPIDAKHKAEVLAIYMKHNGERHE